jgi:hypothetical protein
MEKGSKLKLNFENETIVLQEAMTNYKEFSLLTPCKICTEEMGAPSGHEKSDVTNLETIAALKDHSA